MSLEFGIYTSGKKKQCTFEIAVLIDECEGSAKLILNSCIITHSKKKLLNLVIMQSCVSCMR